MSAELTREKFEAWKAKTGKDKMTGDDWVEWVNEQPDRKKCPCCDEPVFFRKNEDGSVTLDLIHKNDCTLYEMENNT